MNDILLDKVSSTSRATIFKDIAGGMWFMGVYSNNFEDKVGDILTEASHEEYAQWLKSTGVKPPITVIHQPQYSPVFHLVHMLALLDGSITTDEFNANLKSIYEPFAIAETTTVVPMNGFTFVIGKVYDSKRDLVERLLPQLKTWGMSHGFIRLQTNGKIINKYRTFEFSVLPTEFAANWATSVGLITKGGKEPMNDILKSLSPEDQAALQELLDSPVDELEAGTSKAREILTNLLASKQVEVPEVAEVEVAPVVPDMVALRGQIMEDLKVEELVATLKTVGERIQAQDQRIEELTTQLKAVQTSEDEKIAAQFASPNWAGIFKEVPKTDEAKLKEIKDKLPEQVTADAVIDKSNPIAFGFWNQLVPPSGGLNG